MKNNARLYLPWAVVLAFVAAGGGRAAEAQSPSRNIGLAAVERLDGCCVLYRLRNHQAASPLASQKR
jgi:hypothetical protein